MEDNIYVDLYHIGENLFQRIFLHYNKGGELVVKVGGLRPLNVYCDKSYAVGISPQHT